ncbi:aminodeoxychorismate synthase component I [Lysobacter enzymogenes]|uniref:aminodeoxychorismate synthase component I n=1 Tax=Lysobacter enzymogenes TaxID=69 RepID=UPI001AF74E2C|nr:aminodeoxychorismate synthase component I [Lysobacter enzymogenes]QQQ01325.1 aminodeoxychorismate synthase component I [Lysobacter enzymogenes]
MRCLLIDNYDSFTWNLADLIGRAFGQAPTVLRNDAADWDGLRADARYDCIVVSPGPGSAAHAADLGLSRPAIERTALPLLGVCLGFQAIAHANGGRIAHAPEPVHGRPARLRHDGRGLFAGLPQDLVAIRYHSLIAAAPLPPELEASAHSHDGVIMALRHRRRPQWGVQFHPESVLSEHGLAMIGNFRELAHRHRGGVALGWRESAAAVVAARASVAAVESVGPAEPSEPAAPAERIEPVAATPPAALRAWARALEPAPEAESAFAQCYAQSPHAFWLDSQVAGDAACSFMGDADPAQVLAYRIGDDDAALSGGHALLAQLRAELAQAVAGPADALPFEFRGGYVGYFGYEAQALFDGERGHRTDAPDALWMRARRFLAFDHASGRAWAVAVADADGADDAQRWLERTAERLRSLPPAPAPCAPPALAGLDVAMDLGHDDYLAAIGECRRAIFEGESYQVCLTNRLRVRAPLDPLALYRHLRRGNAAPFGAFLRSGAHCVLSTSPERFLRVDGAGRIQAKPIKGTIRRSSDPALDAQYAQRLADSDKDRAENLMIVDLMRNDLNRVAERGSVEVPALAAIESYRTVHQLVSTVEARLRPQCDLIDLLRASFPGGSISGAPKRRTLAIIDRLERSARGVYCGSIGYLGYGRVADLNIGIRTLAFDGEELSFGAGGAITWLSDAESEFQEMLLKAEAVLRPLWDYLGGGAPFACEVRADRLAVEPNG